MNDTHDSEKIATLCKIRDIQRSVILFEQQFEKQYGVSLNEGMVLCSLTKAERLSSGELGEKLGLSPSNISKVIASVEKKGLVERSLGREDKRQMYFMLTHAGRQQISSIGCGELAWPEMLRPLLEKSTSTLR